jgi:hypothetical protein
MLPALEVVQVEPHLLAPTLEAQDVTGLVGGWVSGTPKACQPGRLTGVSGRESPTLKRDRKHQSTR